MWTEGHFELSDQELEEIRRKRERKLTRMKFSQMLSSEAQAAMKLAREDTKEMINLSRNKHSATNSTEIPDTSKVVLKPKKKISFFDAYRNTPDFIMEGDITLPNQSQDSRKMALGGGKLESAMDVVEHVNSESETAEEFDEVAIEETAQRNSVQKCLVWMEVTENEGTPSSDKAT